MSVKCVLKKTNGVFKEKGIIYPEAAIYSRIDQEKFLDGIEKNFNIGRAQTLAVLSAVADQMEEFLANGHSVQVPSLGTFSISMKGKVEERENGGVKLTEAKFDKLRITPDSQLDKKLQKTRFELQSNQVRKDARQNKDKMLDIMAKLSDETGVFIQSQFEQAANCSHGFASTFLAKQLAEGTIENLGTTRRKIYRMASL